MITHEEAKFIVNNLVWERPYQNYHDLLDYIAQQKKKDKLLELYQKSHDCIVCCPHQDTFHCVVRYTDDKKFNRLLNEIKALEEELK